MDYLLSQGYRVDPEASIAVDNAVSKPVFNEFRKRVAEEYASKTVRSLQAIVSDSLRKKFRHNLPSREKSMLSCSEP